jgi:hypothetical protein
LNCENINKKKEVTRDKCIPLGIKYGTYGNKGDS